MKALFYNHTGRASGAERVLLLALQHLDRSVIDPCVVCPPGELADAANNLGIRVQEIGELNARITLWPHRLALYAVSLTKTVRALRSEIKRSDADVVHGNSPRSGIAALLATTGTRMPVIWHVHDEFKPHPITRLIRFCARFSKRCTVVAVSEATARSFVGEAAKLGERVRVIRNAVDIQAIDDKTGPVSIMDEVGLKETDFLFGIVGQITPRKGQFELIKAFARVAERLPAAKLLVIGAPMFGHDTAYQHDVITLTANLGITHRVLFLGHRSDAIEIMKQLDALVINSKSEAFVMVGIEAMACRIPVIATDVGGTREMIDDRVNGFLIPNGDCAALENALINIYEDAELRETFIVRSRARVEKDLNITRFASDFQSALFAAARMSSEGKLPIETHVEATENP